MSDYLKIIMIIQLGKKKPTFIEAAVLKEAGLGHIKGGFLTGYYLEPSEALKITVKNEVILLDNEPIIHQHLNTNRTVDRFTLDIDGLFRKIDPTWNEQTKINARMEKYKKECIDSRIKLYKEFENNLEKKNNAQKEISVARNMLDAQEYATKAVCELNDSINRINFTRKNHLDIYNQYVDGECYNGILGQHEPRFLKSIDEAKILETETARFNSQQNAFDPKINIQVPDSIKKIITHFIDIRIGQLNSNLGIFKSIDKTTQKVAALNDLKDKINHSNCSSSDLKKLIHDWEDAHNVNDSRSRMSIFKTTTATQRMVDNIKEALDTSKKLGK